jgi:hypothetical protein
MIFHPVDPLGGTIFTCLWRGCGRRAAFGSVSRFGLRATQEETEVLG